MASTSAGGSQASIIFLVAVLAPFGLATILPVAPAPFVTLLVTPGRRSWDTVEDVKRLTRHYRERCAQGRSKPRVCGQSTSPGQRSTPVMPANPGTMRVRHVSASASIIAIQGEFSAFSETALLEAYTEATTPTTRVVILNFAGLEYMNSGGIGLLVTLLVRLKQQKQRLLACELSAHYRHIFALTRLEEAISMYASEPEAIAAAHASTAAALEQACPACGAALPMYARFCGRCGRPLIRPGTAPTWG
jgi:anti-sigma B factor antagonist